MRGTCLGDNADNSFRPEEAMNSLRREYFKIVGGVAAFLGTAGGVGWLALANEDGDRNGSGNTENGAQRTQADDESSTGENTGEQKRDQQDQDQQDQDQGKKQEEQEQEELAPDKEDVEPDREKYESDEPERVELPEESVSIDATMEVGDRGSSKLRGTVTNEIDETISIVSLDIVYYDDNRNEIGGGGTSVRDLPAGRAKDWANSVGPDALRGEPAEADITPRPYRYTSGSE